MRCLIAVEFIAIALLIEPSRRNSATFGPVPLQWIVCVEESPILLFFQRVRSVNMTPAAQRIAQCTGRLLIGKHSSLRSNRLSNQKNKQIVPGVTADPSGSVSVDAEMGKILFDVALQLEGAAGYPVDVEHVLAAIILASRSGELDSTTPLSSSDSALVSLLERHIVTVFRHYGRRLGADD